MAATFHERIFAALAGIRARTAFEAEVALIAGTGLSGILRGIEVAARIPYAEIPDFPVPTAPGHRGELVLGQLEGRRVAALDGRFHPYEGWSDGDLKLPVYVLRGLGAGVLIVTNCSGALRPDLTVPGVMLIEDHINFQGRYPLAGPNDDRLGPRFPDMSRPYDAALAALAERAAGRLGLALPRGVYAAVHGPALETNAERRFLRMAGADAVGMSTVIEVTCAIHAGMRVLALSGLANSATGGPDQAPDTLDDILAAMGVIAGDMEALIREVLRGMEGAGDAD